jgi:hypothetical protein
MGRLEDEKERRRRTKQRMRRMELVEEEEHGGRRLKMHGCSPYRTTGHTIGGPSKKAEVYNSG